MVGENPGAYDEARKRIREKSERETIVIEEKKEGFEKSKEKIRSRKKLDVLELKRRIETGQSLNFLKSEIQEALDRGDISFDTYDRALRHIDSEKGALERVAIPTIKPRYTLSVSDYPFSEHPLIHYFDSRKLGENIFIDLGGFVGGVIQGSLFLFWLLGKVIIDTILLPIDLYQHIHRK